jgi:FKBP-type peptidyl-prolyl cis-trans isomerase FkpA
MHARLALACASILLLTVGCAPAPKPAADNASSTPQAEPAPAPDPAAVPAQQAPVALKTDDERVLYAVGLALSRQLSQLALSPAELEIVKRALSDAASGKPALDLEVWGPKIEAFARAREASSALQEKNRGKDYQDKAAAVQGAVRTASGLVYLETRAGSGRSPKATDNVKVHYRGKLIDGAEFDSSYARKEPVSFPLSNVIPCWTEGLQRMKVGGKAQLVCPSDIAYGDSGRPPKIPGGATLVFDVELLGIN